LQTNKQHSFTTIQTKNAFHGHVLSFSGLFLARSTMGFCSLIRDSLFGFLRRAQSGIVRLLLASGASASIVPNALQCEAEFGHDETVKMLLERGQTSPNALECAASNGNVRIVKMLLERGARQTPETSPNALENASRHGHTEIVRMLLESGARQTPETSPNALENAAEAGVAEIVKMLLGSGARQTPSTSPDALKCGARGGHTEIVKMLLDSGAHETRETSSGASVEAFQRRYIEINIMLYHDWKQNGRRPL
jgi:ankyrin repeat protein